MTDEQIMQWLGFRPADIPPGKRIRADIMAGLADVPWPEPGDNAAQLATFRAFLAVAGPPPRRVLEADPAPRCDIHPREPLRSGACQVCDGGLF